MQVNNISRSFAENFPFEVDSKHWMISISSSFSTPALITKQFGRLVQLVFDDIEWLDDVHKRVTGHDIKVIADTIRDAEKEGVQFLWVHCDAGVCRSGAIVECCLLLGHTTDEEVSNERYPNKLVFHELKKVMGLPT